MKSFFVFVNNMFLQIFLFFLLQRPCVYSPGAYINNRSLMPCQEPPVAMSTWQAAIHVPEGCNVLMSGNELLCKTTASNDQGEVPSVEC